MKIEKKPLLQDRVRRINGGFSFIPHRFLQGGFFASLYQRELLVYFLLVLVGDRDGLSYYSQDKLCTLLRMNIDDFIEARNGLIDKDLIAFDGFMFQVMSLPEVPIKVSRKLLKNEDDYLKWDRATIHQVIHKSLTQ